METNEKNAERKRESLTKKNEKKIKKS